MPIHTSQPKKRRTVSKWLRHERGSWRFTYVSERVEFVGDARNGDTNDETVESDEEEDEEEAAYDDKDFACGWVRILG